MSNALSPQIKAKVASATVTKLGRGGQGVLTVGGFVLTAAHCVPFDCEGRMALGDYFISEFNSGRKRYRASTLAVEPVSDIAVLGSPDNQSFAKDATRFDDLMARANPLRLMQSIPSSLEDPFPAWVLTHKSTFVFGKATYFGGASFWLETETKIHGGTSGSPIVTARGELVGVMSNHSEDRTDGKYTGQCPFARFACPAWVLKQMED